MPEGKRMHAEGEGLEWLARWWCDHAWRMPQGSYRHCCALQEGIFETALETKAWVLTSALDRGEHSLSTA